MVRDLSPDDTSQIVKIHADMGMDYQLPDLQHPLIFVKKVFEKDGKVVASCFLRITAETYLLIDPTLTPKEKLEAMLALQPEVMNEAYAKGIDDVEARIPDNIETKFYKRLLHLGWSKCRDGWNNWSRSTR